MTLTPPYDHPVYKPGDVIVEAMPLIYVLKKKFVTTHCGGCFKALLTSSSPLETGVAKLSKCGGCQQIQYCSRECQRFDWRNFHKHECPFYAKHENLFQIETTRLVFRCFILMQHRPEELTKQYDVLGGGKRCFMDLMDHKEEFDAAPEHEKIMDTSFFCSLLNLDVNLSELNSVLCKFYINSFAITNYDSENIGGALYIKTSIFDHSCAPNTSFNFFGLKQQVRAIKDIPARDPISTEYFDIFELRRTRQERLLRTHFFTCTCVRCLSDPSDDGIIMEIHSLEKRINKLNEKSDPGSEDSKLLAELYAKFIPLYKQVCGQYHKNLTHLSIKCLSLQTTDTLVDPLEVFRAIGVTYGYDHPLFQSLMGRKLSASFV